MWICGNYSFDERMPVIMGILNVTPDSFSDGGSYNTAEEAIAAGLAMVDAGAHIIDVGGESTRPGSQEIDPEVELARVLPVVEGLVAAKVCVSIDSRHPSVAQAALEAGASILNNVDGFEDPSMIVLAKASDAGLVVVHNQPLPEAKGGAYLDPVKEVCDYLKARASALEAAGIDRQRLCLDPGPGFSKDASQTLEIVRNIHEVSRLGYPVMAALSRKSYIGEAYGIEEPKERDLASAAEALMACEAGATIIRTHNVALTAQTLKDLRPLVVLSLGSNVALVANPGEEQAGKIAQLNHAISQLCTLPDSSIVDISPFYASEPAYREDQEDFVNAIVLMRCGVPPKELLKYLHVIENSLGRVREQVNGPRTCDIDIVDYQMYECQSDMLTLPHPRALERDFVVAPLAWLRPHFVFADGTTLDQANPIYGKATPLEGVAW